MSIKHKNQLDPYSPGGCFIATACYGSEFTGQVINLKKFRDQFLQRFSLGRKFIDLYYKYSPPVADFLSQNEVYKTLVRFLIVEPAHLFSRFVLKFYED